MADIQVTDSTNTLAACMSNSEQAIMRDRLARARVVLEFGIGGSTGMAAEYDLDRLIGVDSHPDWIARCYLDPRIAALKDKGRVALHRVDIGPVREWGIPADRSQARYWPRYSLDIWSRLEGWTPDFVFVDGRFRLSCALQSLIRLPDLPALGFHDFWGRPEYHSVLDFADVLDRVDQLAILAPKPDLDLRRLGMLASETLLDAR